MIIEGRARILGDDINTDYIISSKRKRETIDESKLTAFLLEGVDPAFAASVRAHDILVAGRNFGCGSAMEVAATVIRAAGIRAVVARSFARSFYRNAINNGLLAVACDTTGVGEGDRLRIVADDSGSRVERADGGIARGEPLPPIMRDILAANGLVAYLRANGRFSI
jgi:3-isopropylmalate/(R)-2-methylmalate dehydratase small subunit